MLLTRVCGRSLIQTRRDSVLVSREMGCTLPKGTVRVQRARLPTTRRTLVRQTSAQRSSSRRASSDLFWLVLALFVTNLFIQKTQPSALLSYMENKPATASLGRPELNHAASAKFPGHRPAAARRRPCSSRTQRQSHHRSSV